MDAAAARTSNAASVESVVKKVDSSLKKDKVEVGQLSNYESRTKAEEKAAKRPRIAKGMHDDIEEMMYGFGDSWPPKEKSIELVESIVTNYLEDIALRAAQVSELRGGKLDKQCFMFVVRKDRQKFNRVYTLLKTNEELKAAQRMEIAKEDPSK